MQFFEKIKKLFKLTTEEYEKYRLGYTLIKRFFYTYSTITVVLLIATVIFKIDITKEGDFQNWTSFVFELGLGAYMAIAILTYENFKKVKSEKQADNIELLTTQTKFQQNKIDLLISSDNDRREKRKAIGLKLLRQQISVSLSNIIIFDLCFDVMIKMINQNKSDSEIDNIWNQTSNHWSRFRISTESLFHTMNSFVADFDEEDYSIIVEIMPYTHEMLDVFVQMDKNMSKIEKKELLESMVIPFLLEYKNKLQIFTKKYSLEGWQQNHHDELKNMIDLGTKPI